MTNDSDFFLLGFIDTSTLVGHFVSPPKEREKGDRRDSRGNEREGQGRKRIRNEREETEDITKTRLCKHVENFTSKKTKKNSDKIL